MEVNDLNKRLLQGASSLPNSITPEKVGKVKTHIQLGVDYENEHLSAKARRQFRLALDELIQNDKESK